jgi:hypothetical protein
VHAGQNLPVVFKLASPGAKWLGATAGVRTGLYLAQAVASSVFMLLSLAQNNGLVPPDLMNPDSGEHGAVDAGHTVHHHAQQHTIVMKLVSSEWLQRCR